MAEGGHNPGEPPLKELEKQEKEKIEKQRWNPDIQVDVKGSENSTTQTETLIGLVYGDVGLKYSDGGRKAERGRKPDEPSPKKAPNETNVCRQSPRILATARGPKDSTVGTSLVIGHVSGDVKYHHDHQRGLLESTRKKISIRTEGMIRVSNVDLLVDKLKSGNKWITVTGNAGDGKTTLGHLVLQEFAEKMNVYVIETPEQYHHISQIEEDHVILLNDIFGAFTFDSTSVNKWIDVVMDIFDIQMKRSDNVTKVLLVNRMPILQEVKVHLEKYGEKITDKQNWFDISQVKKEKERLQILEYHLERKHITLSDWDKRIVANMDTAHGFPHCCEMFAELVSMEHVVGIVDFFKSPLKFLDKTTKILFQNGYRELFISLVKNDGKFNTDSVEDDDKRWTLEEKAKLQEGSYLANYEGYWVFRHPSIYESVMSVVAEKDPLLLVRHASLSVLLQKVRVKTSASDPTTCYILLEPKPRVVDVLAERFIELLQGGHYRIVFEHSLSRNEAFCETLISKYVENEHELINRKDSAGSTMLHHATRASNYTAMKSLLNHGADINMTDKRNLSCLTLFFSNISSISIEILQFLLDKGADVNHDGIHGLLPLHWLCGNKRVSVEFLQVLINSGADINHVDIEGKSPLHRLCKNRRVSVENLQVLINSGADISHVDNGRKTPLHWMCKNTFVSVETLRVLINSGADISFVDNDGKTPLHWLCKNESVSIETLHVLINSGADISFVDNDGKTPLHWLCKNESVSIETLHVLINSGADINHVDNAGKTPLHCLCGNRSVNVETLQLLVNSGVDIRHVNNAGNALCHYLCRNDFSAFQRNLDFLIGDSLNVNPDNIHASDVNKSDTEGNTPLHCLCDTFNIISDDFLLAVCGSLSVLITNGADVHRRNHRGKTPIDLLKGLFLDLW